MKANHVLRESLLFIPDISGFTKFVNQTGIVHSAHIIAELLEIIIKNNILGLKVAEIEGDAVFFYKKGAKPTLAEIYQQCEQMFLAFHQHIRLYERDRICNCGSCANTSNLTLKFVVHYGSIIERNIAGHLQLMGSDVTTIHKLMKNNIPAHQYLLISENSYLKTVSTNLPQWVNLEQAQVSYKNVGNINYQFTYLAPLLKMVPPPPKRKELIQVDFPVVLTIDINCEMDNAYNLLKAIPRKIEWVVGIKKVNYHNKRIERVGTSHECVLPLNTLHIATSKNEVFDDKIIYAENINASGIYPAFTQLFYLEKADNNSCKLKVEIHHESKLLKKFIFEKAMGNAVKKSLIKFKQICEREDIT